MSTEESFGGFRVDELRAEFHPASWRPIRGLAAVLALNSNTDGVCQRGVLREWMRDNWRGETTGTDGNGSRSTVRLRYYLLELEDLNIIDRNDDDTVTVVDWTAINEILDWELK